MNRTALGSFAMPSAAACCPSENFPTLLQARARYSYTAVHPGSRATPRAEASTAFSYSSRL
jgi:hypothetical protein